MESVLRLESFGKTLHKYNRLLYAHNYRCLNHCHPASLLIAVIRRYLQRC
jgi:hypothetical protein